MIRACESLIPKKKIYVFLGGPIQGATNWRDWIPNFGSDVELINPVRSENIDHLTDYEYHRQVEWETLGLRISDIVLFWIPKEVVSIPGRDYAQTTKIELTENLVRGKKVVLGIEPGVNTRRYLVEKYKSYCGQNSTVGETFDQTMKLLKSEIDKVRNNRGVFFTSDTHFNQQRTLELSRRPFKDLNEMNVKMIENWNNMIGPNSTVFHLGDFGDYRFRKYLNGDIKLLCGNYERDDILNNKVTKESLVKKYGFNQVLDRASFGLDIEGDVVDLAMCHEPTKAEAIVRGTRSIDYALFGHIHGRQLIKPFGLDVGVDAHNFKPYSIDDVRFFINALIKGYYDEEVFIQ